MSDSGVPQRPLLHPVLTLRKEPARKEAPAGGKKESDIVTSRLFSQRERLGAQIDEILAQDDQLPKFSGQRFLVAEMFNDSFAISKAPRDLFQGKTRGMLVGAAQDGYLCETNIHELNQLRTRIRNGTSVAVRCDISRVKSIRPYGSIDLYRGRTPAFLWENAVEYEHGRGFYIWLSPFRDDSARNEIVDTLQLLRGQGAFNPTSSKILINTREGAITVTADTNERQNSLAVAQREYKAKGHGRALVEIPRLEALFEIIASGGVFRIEPVTSLGTTAPGQGEEPGNLPPDISAQPIVGLVDGGCSAPRYRTAEAWREPGLVGGFGDTKHGNQVASVIIHGHEWNNNLTLPEIYCRIGVAPAVAKPGSAFRHDPTKLISYLDAVIGRHPETRVWNLSWNEKVAADPVYVSALGHDLRVLARKHNVLLVISAGNTSNTAGDCIAPPADCEAAIVVGGRQFDRDSNPTTRCPESLPGFGPELQLVPHITSFSPLRLLGGGTRRGTSFSTGLISALAAHTFENLRDPTPDLVRALIVDKTDLDDFDKELGWGTPCSVNMPWNCSPGTVTLAFRANLKAGMLHYWEDIPIPRELVKNRKLFGRASITTVHRPLCNEDGGPNYFATRVAAAIQYPNAHGVFTRLVGSSEIEETPELTARVEEYKWQPFRRDCRDFTKRGGIGFKGSTFKVYARLYSRNAQQFGYYSNAEIPEVETVFVVTFSDTRRNSQIYNTMTASLGNYVESAVVAQEIGVEH